ncbi:helix-turn-helix transcriptional regulator [Maridesulfovibrio sp. FT414]|uniref:helix-turn-helix transcriptional regulator n=1 Tax=Maridesulfovibrio sp. FT414 TaxID=2979469 RepID=UPI003D8060B4
MTLSAADYYHAGPLSGMADGCGIEPLERISSSEGLNWQGVFVQRSRIAGFEMNEFSTPFHCFALLTDGPFSMEIVKGRNRYLVTTAPGQMYVRPAGFKISARSNQPREFVQLALDSSRLASAFSGEVQGGSMSFRPGIGIDDPRLKALIEAFAAEAEAGGPNGSLFVDSLATALAVHYISNYADNAVLDESARKISPLQMERIVEYMDAHLGSNLTLEDLSHEIGMSKFYFSRLFKEETGVSPYQFYLSRRLDKARHLLDEGRKSITEIAHQLNFSDQSHFSRVFRKKYGINPKAYIEHAS